jgi:hypothetical protein
MKFLAPDYSCHQNPILGSYHPRSPKKILLYEMKFLVPNYSCLQKL